MEFGHFADLLLGILVIALFPYFGFLLVTTLAAILGRWRRRVAHENGDNLIQSKQRFLVVVPAHNEQTVIETTLRSLAALDYPVSLFQVLVIADNCTDRTADKARESGARVFERFSSDRRSKGYAIEDLIESLRSSGEFDSLDALVVVDADSTVDSKLLQYFAMRLDSGQEWIQCYDCVGNADQSWRTRLMAFAFSLINGVTLMGQDALGLSAGLRGNGMCLSTRGLRRVPWKTNGLTEDIEYSWLVRIAGGRLAFEREAVVYATMLSQGGSASVSQRQRWESGRHALKRKLLGPLLRSTHLGWIEKTASVIELTMPTTTSILGIYLILSLLAYFRLGEVLGRQDYVLFFVIGLYCSVATLAFAIQAASPFLLSLIPWRFMLSLIYLPYYAIWKLVVALKAGPTMWVPTVREPGHAAAISTSISAPNQSGVLTTSSESYSGA